MAASTPREESMAAIISALNPLTWRCFPSQSLARRVVAAHDRQNLADLLQSVPGTAVGPWADLPPADRHDPRVRVLVDFLDSRLWRGVSVRTLCRNLVTVLHEVA